MVNKLYGILTNGAKATGTYEWYNKQCENPMHTQRMDTIRNIVLTGVDNEHLNFFACTICGLVRNSAFAAEILALDPNNTYSDPSRPTDAAHSNADYCFYTLVQPVQTYRLLKGFLDKDLAAKLAGGSWLDYIAAGCAQMLREADL